MSQKTPTVKKTTHKTKATMCKTCMDKIDAKLMCFHCVGCRSKWHLNEGCTKLSNVAIEGIKELDKKVLLLCNDCVAKNKRDVIIQSIPVDILKEEKVVVLMAGPNDVLKLAILAKMKEKNEVPLILDKIANFKVKKIDFNVWEIKGKNAPVCEPLDSVLEQCLMKSKALIYVLDVSDIQERIEESIKDLRILLRAMKECPVLIFFNKVDKNPSFGGKTLISQLKSYEEMTKRTFKFHKCYKSTNDENNYLEGFIWLAEQLKGKQKSEKKKNKEDDEEDDEEEGKKEGIRVVMAGLSNTGKSTILSKMTENGEVLIVKEKIELDDRITYKVLVVSEDSDPKTVGKDSNIKDIKALVFVMEEKNELRDLHELKKFLGIKQLKKNPLLILYNQDGSKDNKGSENVSKFEDMLSETIEKELKDRNDNYYVQACTVTTDEGFWPGFKMLETLLKKRKELKKTLPLTQKLGIPVQKDKVFVVMTGLSKVGKSAIFANLFGENNRSKKGFQQGIIEYCGMIYKVWLLPTVHLDNLRVCKEVLKNIKLLVFVVDSTVDSSNSLDKLQRLLRSEYFVCCPLLIFYNKIDLPGSIKADCFKKSLSLKLGPELTNRAFFTQPCSTVKQIGLATSGENFKSLIDNQKKRGKNVGIKYSTPTTPSKTM